MARRQIPLLAFLLLLFAPGARAFCPSGGFDISVLVDGVVRPEYAARGNVYVEAIRGRDYSLRISNPLPVRVAVALSVDGLNTIDARHTDSSRARKWVLAPYETVVISGWQVSGETARKFFFTGERSSYAAKLGQTENLGLVQAVFYREREPYRQTWKRQPNELGSVQERDVPSPKARAEAGAAAPAAPESSAKLSDDYAATGMGGRVRHEVTEVALDLDPTPVATLKIRYEFRPALEKLGVFPRLEDPLDRRERSRGFGPFCPER
jgi:hypothetical protein